MSSKPEQEQAVNSFRRLNEIVAVLRAEGGCPWDRRQTAESLKKYLLEEAAELSEAIDRNAAAAACEEAGDLYFVLALLMAVFEEQGLFSAADALDSACKKMERRHPHVFASEPGQRQVLSDAQLRAQWERIKQEERLAGGGQG